MLVLALGYRWIDYQDDMEAGSTELVPYFFVLVLVLAIALTTMSVYTKVRNRLSQHRRKIKWKKPMAYQNEITKLIHEIEQLRDTHPFDLEKARDTGRRWSSTDDTPIPERTPLADKLFQLAFTYDECHAKLLTRDILHLAEKETTPDSITGTQAAIKTRIGN